jgi:GH18 family chitinase
MKTKFYLLLLLCTGVLQAQYSFPVCETAYVTGTAYTQGQKVSLNGINYQASYWVQTPPPSAGWVGLGACGNADLLLGPSYPAKKRIIGYLATWRNDFNYVYDPTKLTHVIIPFVLFKQNNSNYNSADFASIAFDPIHVASVNTMLIDKQVLAKSHNVGTKVLVAVGGATDYAFLWLMTKYSNDDAKLQEIAQLIVNYTNTNNIDGIDLDMECWWADPAVGTVDQGGRVRGDKWGGADAGPHPAGIGLKKLAQKIKQLKPSILLSAVSFGTAYYGNNYDDGIADSLDWLGLFTYDYTGSWNASSFGPHTALRKVPLSTYPLQTLDNPIYSTEDALEFWQGLAAPAWNHDGGFNVKRAKLCIGAAFYGYDFANKKPAGNGFNFVEYKDIMAEFPSANTSYDALDPQNFSGHITANSSTATPNGKNIYYETPASIKNKYKYVQDYGQQGIIIWELSYDLPASDPKSLLYSLNSVVNPGTLATKNFDYLDSHVFANKKSIYYNFDATTYDTRIQVYNLLSQKVITHDLTTNQKSGILETTLPSGVYVVKYGQFTKKIRIE